MPTVGWILILLLVFNIGFVLGYWLKKRMPQRYDGIMLVTKDEDNVLYSLELAETPDELENRKEIVFKVETLEERLSIRR